MTPPPVVRRLSTPRDTSSSSSSSSNNNRSSNTNTNTTTNNTNNQLHHHQHHQQAEAYTNKGAKKKLSVTVNDSRGLQSNKNETILQQWGRKKSLSTSTFPPGLRSGGGWLRTPPHHPLE